MGTFRSEYIRNMNDFNCTLVDQYCEGIISRNPEFFQRYRQERQQALAFVVLAIKTYLRIDEDEATDYVTDGTQDYGIAGMCVGTEDKGELPVTLFQCKYRMDLSGNSNFPANAVEKAFGVNLENNTAMLNNVVSRKKQIAPPLLEVID